MAKRAKLVSRAMCGLSIYVHPDGVYQVIRGRRRASTTPVFTSRDFTRANSWRKSHC